MTQIRKIAQGMLHAISSGCTLAIVLFLGLISVPGAKAQVLYGSLTGTVTDSSKAAVPNATITALDQGTGTTRTTTTNTQGEFTIGDLQPGTYSVIVNPTGGFSKYTQKNLAVSVNQDTRVDVILQLSSITSEVTINTAAPMLQTQDAEVNHNITQSQLAELPITSSQGRNFQSLYTLVPGTANVVEQNSTASNPSRAMSVNVNGIEDMGNTTRIDGAINTYGWLPYLIAYVPPADAIQTVNIATNSFNAEQGEAGGSSINVITKSGTRDFHGSLWEYNQLFNTNARPYTSTPPPAQIPKNIFNQFGFSVGGPVYIPKILISKTKLFFFQDFQRTTRRQLITGLQTVPTSPMLTGDFSAVSSITTLYDPQPGGPNTPFLPFGSRPTFQSEYGCNCIPASRQFPGSAKMLALLKPISDTVGTPTSAQLNAFLANDYNGAGTLSYNSNISDSKVTYNPSDATSIFGRYSINPFSVTDPQELGNAGGGTFDGGQPGAAAGRIQNIGLGMNHVITPHMVIDADFGYTRQRTGAQSLIDIAAGDFGLNTMGIPGTNGPGINYVGQPSLMFTGWSAMGNSNGANPFLFRDNQFTADVNLSWTKGRHSTKYGSTYYHFLLNHFQPTSGSDINAPRGGFRFKGGMTINSGAANAYNSLADFLLGMPNNDTGAAVAKPFQLSNPNALRWSQYAVYAQDQWSVTPKLTLTYGARYEYYPAPYRDHTGVYRLDPTLPQSANVEIGGVNGNPENAGIDMGWGQITPRLGIAYRVTDKTVIRTGVGVTSDPDSLRFLRDSFPIDLAGSYSGAATNSIAVDASGNPLPLSVGIPVLPTPNISTGFASLPIGSGTNTVASNYRRGYIESWNLFVQQDLGNQFVLNVGYVGTHQVRQLGGYTLNAGPLSSGATICMANGQFNPSSPYFTKALGSNPCNSAANQLINIGAPCPAGTAAQNQGSCYNTGGITMNRPIWSSNYNGLQSQLTRNAGRLAQFGLVYTWSHAFNYQDNGAGSGSTGNAFSYPGYFKFNRATASYDRTNNLQFWGIYHLPFGAGHQYLNHGIASAIFGGFQLNGQLSHTSGAPFSIANSSSTGFNAPGNTLYADLVKPYHQIGGHSRTSCTANSGCSSAGGGTPWFDPTAFANPVEPTYSATQLPGTIITPHFGSTHRNQFRGPGQTTINASVFRGFHIYHESEFQVRVEAFNLLNHAIINNPNATITPAGGNFGYITSFGGARTLQFSGRFNF